VEATVAEHEPAIRRLCVATAVAPATTAAPGLLTLIQESGGFYRLYVTPGPEEGIELAFAAPGLDEMSLVADLIDAMRREAAAANPAHWPVVASFHVGMTKVVGEALGGAGADRALALVRDPSVRVAAAAGQLAQLAVVVAAGLFADLRAEGLRDTDWRAVPSADAWLKLFDTVPGGEDLG
jgi:hypothetical protein